jgi:hypothetical protein
MGEQDYAGDVPEKSRTDRIHDRIEKSETAAATFARIGEEFKSMRNATPSGPERDRLDRLIDLNTQTAAVIRRTLAINERDLGREKEETEGIGPG